MKERKKERRKWFRKNFEYGKKERKKWFRQNFEYKQKERKREREKKKMNPLEFWMQK